MDDVRAVMDAAGSERAVVYGVSEGGPMAMLFAATYPARTIALILYGTDADYTWHASNNPVAYEEDEYLEYIDTNWGTIEHAREEIRAWGAPSHADDDRLAEWLASYLRRAASPGAAISLARMNRQINVSHVLPAIHVPTLLLAKVDDVEFPIARMRWIATQIAGARLLEFPGDAHFFWVEEFDSMLREIEHFVGEFREQEAELERFLATVLFTDIVDSTATAAALGDRRWKETVEAHHTRVRGQLARYRGTGDRHGGRRVLRDVRRSRPRDPLRDRDGRGRPRPWDPGSGGPAHRRGRADRRQGRRDRRQYRRPGGGAGERFGGRRLADREGPGGGLGPRVRGCRRARAEGRPRSLAPVPGGEVGHFEQVASEMEGPARPGRGGWPAGRVALLGTGSSGTPLHGHRRRARSP